MKSFKEYLCEMKDKETDPKYKEYFNKMLSKHGVEDPSELDKDQKKKFFDEVDAGWKSDSEK